MTLRKAALFALATAVAVNGFMGPAAAQDRIAPPPEMTQYHCLALEQASGHEEPSLTSPPTRMPDGRLRMLDKDESGYASMAAGEPPPRWIALYSSPQGHENTFMGHFQSASFKCRPANG